MNHEKQLCGTRFVAYLFRYMLLFGINRFCMLDLREGVIKAQVGWADRGSPYYDEDEDAQEIEWDIQNIANMEDALQLAEYLIDNHLLRGDKIIVEPEELRKRLHWDLSKFELASKALLEIKVDMVDDEKKTDYFFLHY